MKNDKRNWLANKVVEVISQQAKGSVLDLGCGDGEASIMLHKAGFDVTACDMDVQRFLYHKNVKFVEANLVNRLPFPDNSFDYLIFCEVIEHIYIPDQVIGEISRVLKPGGQLILSTPNILNISSRFRFLLDGSYDFFREPILDYHKVFPLAPQNMHIVAWRYHELEYLLYKNHLHVAGVYTDKKKTNFTVLKWLLLPFIWLNARLKQSKARKREGVQFERIDKIMMSDEILLGRHLILRSVKKV